jgi:LPS sulfotransferase NodH
MKNSLKESKSLALLCGSEFDEPKSNQLKKRYVILASERTGSTYVANRLCNIKNKFGVPSEYLNPRAIEFFLPRLFEKEKKQAPHISQLKIVDYLHAIEEIRTTADGFFGIKIQPFWLLKHFKNKVDYARKFLHGYDYIIALTRRNKLEQALSYSIALQTDEWHPGVKEINFDEETKKKAYLKMSASISRFFIEQDFILSLKGSYSKPFIHIEYEDIADKPEEIFQKIFTFLSQNNHDVIEETSKFPVPQKNSSALSKELKNNYFKFINGELN